MLVEALLQMCDRDVVDNHKSCSEYFWLMNRYAIMVTAQDNCFLFFSPTHSSFSTFNPRSFARRYLSTTYVKNKFEEENSYCSNFSVNSDISDELLFTIPQKRNQV